MATERARLPHEERTADEPRDPNLHAVILKRIQDVNSNIRLFRLSAKDQTEGILFRPGQWLDVFCPGVSEAGGFTITSTTHEALPPTSEVELAVQKSFDNSPVAWLWRPEGEILEKELIVRVGGSFTWPPPSLDVGDVDSVLFVAGGIGINPLMSMISEMHWDWTARGMKTPARAVFFYSTKVDDEEVDPKKIPFLDRLKRYESDLGDRLSLTLFITGEYEKLDEPEELPWHLTRRMQKDDLDRALGDVEKRKRTLCYVCGPPAMTDEFVQYLSDLDGLNSSRVLCERWW